ncbi:MAG: DUF4149 domain-containing protein [Treponema sp.]|jgi:hypothetical protein|nr:DUF4149 domain-containing protein [Treponema sp.]
MKHKTRLGILFGPLLFIGFVFFPIPFMALGRTLYFSIVIIAAGLLFFIRALRRLSQEENDIAFQKSPDTASVPSRTQKRWTAVVVLALCMFVCHLGALLGFLPGILQVFPAALALLAASLACWGLLSLLLVRYRKDYYPISQKIEELIHDTAPFFPPKSILTVYREMKAIEGSIRAIREKNKAAGDYIRLLKKNTGDPAAKSLLSKYKEYNKYFESHYAGCCSAYLNKRFELYIILIKEILLPGKKIHTLDIEGFINSIKDDLNSARYILTDKAYPARTSAGKTTKPAGPEKPPARSKSGKPDDTADDMVLDKIAETAAALEKKIPQLTVYLITAQSSKTIAGTSPLTDGKSLLDIYDLETDFDMDIEYVRQLEDEFDRFMAERELSAI